MLLTQFQTKCNLGQSCRITAIPVGTRELDYRGISYIGLTPFARDGLNYVIGYGHNVYFRALVPCWTRLGFRVYIVCKISNTGISPFVSLHVFHSL